jgi:Flp pilus assembly protein TadG
VVVEFAIVSVLLMTLVFGVIQFGLLLSFKQDMTRAAAEGARAGAVALPVGAQTPEEAARDAALAAVKEAVPAFGGSFATSNPDDPDHGCQRDGMSCPTPTVAPCVNEPTKTCVTVTLHYDYETHPLFGRVPLIQEFLPQTVAATSVARINQ